MKNLRKVCAICTLGAVLSPGTMMFAQEHRDDDNRNSRTNDERNDRRDNRTYDQRDNGRNDRHYDRGDNRGYGDHSYVRHDEWKKGYRMRHDDWDRGQRVDDYQQYHLRRPPSGYEWREIDGNYVLPAVATGAIASVIERRQLTAK